MRYLYQLDLKNRDTSETKLIESGKTIDSFKPSLFQLFNTDETVTLKSCLSRLYFCLISGGRFKIYYIYVDNQIAHCSYVVSSRIKFRFLSKGDWEIGPCITYPKYRRKGCYHTMLRYIASVPEYSNSSLYMIVNAANLPSVKGIEKAGFHRVGEVKKTVFKNYIMKEGFV